MSGRFRLQDFGAAPRLSGVLRYLTQRRWKMEFNERTEMLHCEGPSDDSGAPIVKVIPQGEHFSDYHLRLEDLIYALTVIENRPAVEIIREMNQHAEESDADQRAPNGMEAGKS